MKQSPIYKYNLENGGIALIGSKVTDYEEMVLLEADEGKLLTDGSESTKSILTPLDNIDTYYEIDEVEEIDSTVSDTELESEIDEVTEE